MSSCSVCPSVCPSVRLRVRHVPGSSVAVLGRGRVGPLPPHFFVQVPQFFHRLPIIAPLYSALGSRPPPRIFLARTVTVDHVKTTKDIFEIFHHRVVLVLVFRHQARRWYSDGNHPNGGVECRLGRQKSRFWAYMPVVDAATGEVLCTWSPVNHGHHLASCDTYRWSHTVGIWPPSTISDKVTVSVVLQRDLDKARSRTLALYTITIDRVYDSKAWRYAEDNRTESNCTQ